MSKSGQRLQSFLRFRVKLVLSQVFLKKNFIFYIFFDFKEKVYSDESKKIEYEMKNLHDQLEKHEYRLKNLREYFELPLEEKKEAPKTVK